MFIDEGAIPEICTYYKILYTLNNTSYKICLLRLKRKVILLHIIVVSHNVIVETNILESNLHDVSMCMGEKQFV